MRILLLILYLLLPTSANLSDSVRDYCMEFSFGQYSPSEFSVYIVDVPTELHIVLYNGTTEYKFQGTGNYAIRAVLPKGQYRFESYYWYEKTSQSYYIDIKEGYALHISGFPNMNCIANPSFNYNQDV